jgi:tRNA-dihydrouridine synthase B
MAGISDLPFRLINRSFGCPFAFTEMISASSLVHGSRHTRSMLATTAEDRPLGVQLLGGDPIIIRKALDILGNDHFDVVDFNAACPVSKVVSRGEGAALLKDPLRLQDLLREIVSATDKPVTVKIRSGWDGRNINARDVALRAEDAGVRAVFIHGRTKAQGYAGSVDYGVIRAVKESLAIPVIASGDALSPELVRRMFDVTGCDGVVMARGALGNPWIFPQTAGYLDSGTVMSFPGIAERKRVMQEHLSLNISFHGERRGVIHEGTRDRMMRLIDEM